MTVLAQDIQRPNRGVSLNKMEAIPMAGYTNKGSGNEVNTIYKGSVVVVDVSDTDGYCRAVPDTSSVNMASGDVFVGIADEYQTTGTTITADGGKSVSVARDGVWAFAKGSCAQTDIGAPAYASDDNTVTPTSTNALWIGTIVGVDGTYVYVDITRAAGMPNSAT